MAKRLFKNNSNDFKDLGFGTQIKGRRMLNEDGSFNVIRKGVKGQSIMNLYTSLITMSWMRFNVIVLSYYLIINLIFAALYMLIGKDSLIGESANNLQDHFWNAFFFSAQTITTVGYGYIHPSGMISNFLAAIESMAGLFGFALATGLLYGRFSRPVAKILFSNKAVIAPYQGATAFMFRLANLRSNQLIDTNATLNFSMMVKKDGVEKRIFDRLKLERDKIDFFPTSWTIVHPINENSPIYGMTEDEVNESDAEFILLLSAFDDTFSQTVHARRSYKHYEIEWGAKFPPMTGDPENNKTVLFLDKIDNTIKAELPTSD